MEICTGNSFVNQRVLILEKNPVLIYSPVEKVIFSILLRIRRLLSTYNIMVIDIGAFDSYYIM